jgi:multiple sugar transport system permease protein
MKRGSNRIGRLNAATGLAFAAPWIIGFCLFYAYPIVISFYYSLTSFNIFQAPKFIGLANYTRLFSEALFYKSLVNTLFITLLGVPINLAFGLVCATLLNARVRGLSVYRTLFYLPAIIPLVATSILWVWIYDAQFGLINSALHIVGLPQPNWLDDARFTKPALLLVGMWGTGQIAVIFLAALQDVPVQLYEAAEIDGASRLRKFRHITLPLLSPVILFQSIMGVIAGFQYFTQAYLMVTVRSGLNDSAQAGGPENSLMFYAMLLFHNAFTYLKMGKAAAMAWILFLIIGLITFLLIKSSKRWVQYGAD